MKRKLFVNPYFIVTKSLVDKSEDKKPYEGSDYLVTITGSRTYHTPVDYFVNEGILKLRELKLDYNLVKKTFTQRNMSTQMAKNLFDSIINKLENDRRYKHINTRKDTWSAHYRFKDRVEGYNTSKVFSKGKRNMIVYSAPPGKGFRGDRARVWVLFEPVKQKKDIKPSFSRFRGVFPHIWKQLEEKLGDDFANE
tara:strand:- start:2122 stop:2706 length:585 start_codon:yes stop_codon:yes gene_type:complete